MRRRTRREDVAAALRERLQAADQSLTVPPDLWDRIRTPPATTLAGVAPPTRRRPRFGAGPRPRQAFRVVVGATALALAIGSIATGAWWLSRPVPSAPATAAADGAIPLTVYNAETACRPLRTQECALGLARDPYARYSAPGNAAGKVWNGDRVAASCVVTDGTLVEDEAGVTSRRWYLVATADGVRGWLPGVRTRNTTDVRDCTPAEARQNSS